VPPGTSGDRFRAPGWKPPGRAWRQRLPTGDDARDIPRLQVVGDTGEQAPQLDRSRQLASLLECGTDRGGFRFGNDEHLRSMVKLAGIDKRLVGRSAFHARLIPRRPPG